MIRITCHSKGHDCGSDRTLATFIDGSTAIDQETAKSKALNWLDDMLDAVKGFGLFAALDRIRAECNLGKDPKPFPSAAEMPLCILNLVLKEHGLELGED